MLSLGEKHHHHDNDNDRLSISKRSEDQREETKEEEEEEKQRKKEVTIMKRESEIKSQTGGNCMTCNRRFCLDYHLPICTNAKEEDIFTTCFRQSQFFFPFFLLFLLPEATKAPSPFGLWSLVSWVLSI